MLERMFQNVLSSEVKDLKNNYRKIKRWLNHHMMILVMFVAILLIKLEYNCQNYNYMEIINDMEECPNKSLCLFQKRLEKL